MTRPMKPVQHKVHKSCHNCKHKEEDTTSSRCFRCLSNMGRPEWESDESALKGKLANQSERNGY